MAQYQQLWHQLGELRKARTEHSELDIEPPSRLCPFNLYQSYSSTIIGLETYVQINAPVSAVELNERRNLAMISFAAVVLPSEANCQLILDKLEGIQGAITVSQLAVLVNGNTIQQQNNLILILTWLHKQSWVSLN